MPKSCITNKRALPQKQEDTGAGFYLKRIVTSYGRQRALRYVSALIGGRLELIYRWDTATPKVQEQFISDGRVQYLPEFRRDTLQFWDINFQKINWRKNYRSRGVRDIPQENSQNQLTWVHWGSQGLKPPTREHAWDGPRPSAHVAGVQFGLHVGLLTGGAGAVSDSVPCL